MSRPTQKILGELLSGIKSKSLNYQRAVELGAELNMKLVTQTMHINDPLQIQQINSVQEHYKTQLQHYVSTLAPEEINEFRRKEVLAQNQDLYFV